MITLSGTLALMALSGCLGALIMALYVIGMDDRWRL